MKYDHTKPIFIGLHGKQQSGKDEIANLLTHLIPQETGGAKYSTVCRFSDPIYSGAALALRVPRSIIKQRKTECRPLLQELGKCIRAVTPNRFRESLSEFSTDHNTTVLIIPDVRRIPDIQDIWSVLGRDNGVLVKVLTNRKNREERARAQNIELIGEDDVTETELDNYEVKWFKTIYNNGSKGALYDQVLALIDDMMEPFRLRSEL